MPRKPNEAPIRYDREDMQALLVATGMIPEAAGVALDVYEAQRAAGPDMPCQSVVHHGPGHQGNTYCQLVGGDKGHDHIGADGRYDPEAPPRHYARLDSGDIAEWTDDNPFAEYRG
jgi:hypothetical protein